MIEINLDPDKPKPIKHQHCIETDPDCAESAYMLGDHPMECCNCGNIINTTNC